MRRMAPLMEAEGSAYTVLPFDTTIYVCYDEMFTEYCINARGDI